MKDNLSFSTFSRLGLIKEALQETNPFKSWAQLSILIDGYIPLVKLMGILKRRLETASEIINLTNSDYAVH